MERVRLVHLRGTPVLRVDYSGLHDPAELQGVARHALARVRSHEGDPLLVLADLTDVPHNLVTAAIMQQGVAESRSHVRARAVVGLTPEASGSFDVAAKLLGSPMARFDDEAAALEWLLQHAPGKQEL